MSVLIKGIEMPTSCSECGQFRWNNFLQSDVCRIAEAIGDDGIFQSENEGIDNRPFWCPLVSIFDVPQWIPVTEQLPKMLDGENISKEVYVTDGTGIAEACIMHDYDGVTSWTYTGIGEITHWCEQIPLPQPPKEE